MTIPSDAPKGSIICPDCGGSGLVAGWAPGPMQTAEDCDRCRCEGWLSPDDENFDQAAITLEWFENLIGENLDDWLARIEAEIEALQPGEDVL